MISWGVHLHHQTALRGLLALLVVGWTAGVSASQADLTSAETATAAVAGWMNPNQPVRVIMPAMTQGAPKHTRVIWPKSASAQLPSTATKPVAWSPATTGAPPASRSRLTPQMQQTLMRASQHYGVDAYLIKAVIHAESAFNPLAISSKNAIGLMQVLPTTAQDMGLQAQDGMSVEQLLTDPRVSIVVGTRYLAEQLQRFGSVELALAAYNAGPGAVMRSGNRVPNYPETRAYIQRVQQLQRSYRQARSLDASAGKQREAGV